MVCLSTLLSTAMAVMADVIELLNRNDLREKVTVLVGGGPVSQSFADRIGADGYAENAISAARPAKKLLLQKAEAHWGKALLT
ncbi:Dimethylamine corrinoid protein 2 (fragment) [Syntrophobacter sp. SbD1]